MMNEKILWTANRMPASDDRNLAAMCDACYEVVYGIPIPLKGGAA